MRNKLVSRRALNLRANGRAQNLMQIYFLVFFPRQFTFNKVSPL